MVNIFAWPDAKLCSVTGLLLFVGLTQMYLNAYEEICRFMEMVWKDMNDVNDEKVSPIEFNIRWWMSIKTNHDY